MACGMPLLLYALVAARNLLIIVFFFTLCRFQMVLLVIIYWDLFIGLFFSRTTVFFFVKVSLICNLWFLLVRGYTCYKFASEMILIIYRFLVKFYLNYWTNAEIDLSGSSLEYGQKVVILICSLMNYHWCMQVY